MDEENGFSAGSIIAVRLVDIHCHAIGRIDHSAAVVSRENGIEVALSIAVLCVSTDRKCHAGQQEQKRKEDLFQNILSLENNDEK